MPFTIYHLGIAVFLAALGFDLISLVFGSVLVDLDGIGFLFGYGNGFHGPLHSILGATLLAIFVVMPLSYLAHFLFGKVKEGHTMNFENIAIGSLLGTLGHVLLDGMVYPELNFIWPFGFWNDFSSLLAYADAARICEVLFVLGIVMFGVKTMYKLAIARVTRKEQLQLEPDVMQEQIGFSDSLHAHDVNDSELPVQTSCSASYADKYKQPRTNLQKICPNRKFTIYDKKIKEKNTKQKSGPKINRIIIKRKNKK